MSKLKKSKSRYYTNRTVKLLWGRAAGRCAFQDCRREIIIDERDSDPIVIIGDLAHIQASSEDGPRGNQSLSTKDRDNYENLILLCKCCHAKADGQPNKYSIDLLHKIKSDHENWVRYSLPEQGLSVTPWHIIILKGDHPVDIEQTIAALLPDNSQGVPQVISVSSRVIDWSDIYLQLNSFVEKIYSDKEKFNLRFAIFPLASVSACISLGFLLTDRPRVKIFQYHRHLQTWSWSLTDTVNSTFKISGLPKEKIIEKGDVKICIEVSANIEENHRENITDSEIGEVFLRVSKPSTTWLESPFQISQFGASIQELFECIYDKFPNAERWHILAAVPAPIALRIGQAMNPTMIPPSQLYEFNRSQQPAYKPSICLQEEKI